MPAQLKEGISSLAGFNTLINVLMGTGPILLPPCVASAGFAFSVIVLIIMAIFSIIAAQFMIEMLAICNCLRYVANEQVKENQQELENNLVNQYSSSQSSELDSLSAEKAFDMKETIEYGQMGKIFWGRKGELINGINILIYLYGALISKGIMVGNILSGVFQNVDVLKTFTFWVVLFYCVSGALSFKNLSAISFIQTGVAAVRYLVIFTMFIACFILYGYGESSWPILEFKPSNFGNLFGTTVFAFMCHHSIPQILRPIKPQNQIKYVGAFGFSFATLIFILVPFTGMIAFPELSAYDYYSQPFDTDHVKFAYYFISFYIFLNISALPVMTLTIRNNMMKMFVPNHLPRNSFEVTRWTALFTILIIGPSGVLALGIVDLLLNLIALKNDIEFVVGMTGGVCGVIILMILPSLLVITGRKECPINPQQNPFKSNIQGDVIPWIMVVLGIIFIPYNIYLQIQKLLN